MEKKSAEMKHLEHSGVIQGRVEELSLGQIYLRDDLFQKHGLSFADATAVVRGEKKASDFGIEGQDEKYQPAPAPTT